jgi:hypothetical protein
LKIQLIPKTRKGKNKIHEAGGSEFWFIVRRKSSVPALGNRAGLLISPTPDEEPTNKHVRWIFMHNDPDFDWNEVS